MKPLNKSANLMDTVFGTLPEMADRPLPVREIEINFHSKLIDFDAMRDADYAWKSVRDEKDETGFSLVFHKDRLYLVYEEVDEGIERAYDVGDAELIDEILSVLIQYKNWKQHKK